MPPPLIGIAAGLALFPAISAYADPYIEFIRQQSFSEYATRLLTPEQFAVAARRGIRNYDVLAQLSRRNGINESQFKLLVDLQRQFLDVGEVIASARRGIMDEQAARGYLASIGYEGEDQDRLLQLSFIIPPVSDLITMAVKEAFNDEFAREFTTDQEFPEEVGLWGMRQGLSLQWSRRYWRAHWDLPSISQGAEMLHRAVITPTQFSSLAKALDIAPFWREKFEAISYIVPRLVDIRNWRREEVITYDEMKRLYMDRGYNSVNAERAARHTEANVFREKKAELKELTAPLRSTIANAVVSGTVSEMDAREQLRLFGDTDAEISLFFDLAAVIRTNRIETRILERVGDLYVKGRATLDEVTPYLKDRGFSDAEIKLRLEEWEVEKELRAPTERDETDRDLTKSEILASYKDGDTDRSTAQNELAAMRYDPSEVERLLDMADHDINKAKQKDEETIIENRVMRGELEETDATAALDAVGVKNPRRDALISTWFRRIEERVYDIPISTLQAWMEKEIRTVDETLEALLARRLKPRDADDLIRLWNAKAWEKAERKRREEENRAAKEAAKKG